jgi:hypothetical protein
MAASEIAVRRGVASSVDTGGVAVAALPSGALGGYIVNPYSRSDQGTFASEVLYVDPTGPATLFSSDTTVALQPGQAYIYQAGQTEPVWVNAHSSGHLFTSVVYLTTVPFPPTPIPSSFPPAGPPTTIMPKSYLYEEYSDDSDLQAFVSSYNSIAQNFLDTINALNLPIYTGPMITGALLDWVGRGLYGMARPALATGERAKKGMFNTYMFNAWQLNKFALVGPTDIVATTDDIYRRILTWHLYKGDGKVFNIRWLKRRIMRFLIGDDGSAPNIDQTYQISVTFGANNSVSIRLLDSIASVEKAALFNKFMFNALPFNYLKTKVTPLTPLPNRVIFKEAFQSGALEMPFQYTYTVTI